MNSVTGTDATAAPIPITAGNSGVNSGKFQRGNPYRWKAGGPSPNPSGRPRRALSDALQVDLERRLPNTPEFTLLRKKLNLSKRATFAEAIARSMVMASISDLATAREVADRAEDRAVERRELGGADGRDIRITVSYETFAHEGVSLQHAWFPSRTSRMAF